MPQMGIPLGNWALFRLRCAPFPEQFALSDPAGQRVAQPFLSAIQPQPGVDSLRPRGSWAASG